jgi:hypothetical protein
MSDQQPPTMHQHPDRGRRRRSVTHAGRVGLLLLVVAVAAAGCAGEDQMGSPSHRMIEWVGGTGLGGDIGTLNADNARIPLDVPNGTGAIHAACGTIEDDADMANGELPSPDPQVTDWLSDAYGLEGTAATECYDAGASNTKLLAESARNTAKAHALIERALIRIQSIIGHPVSTTTTTDNATGGIFG